MESFPPERARLLTAMFASSSFRELGLTVSLWRDGLFRAIHLVTDTVMDAEVVHGTELLRWQYNEKAVTKVKSTGRALLGEHAGFCDLWVPVDGRGPGDILVAGPFARERPTASVVLERWHAISHSHANLADPTFQRYLTATMGTLALEGSTLRALQTLLSCLARVLGQRGNAEALAAEWDTALSKLQSARAPERLWEVARSMIDDRTTGRWQTAIGRDPLLRMGFPRPPSHAVVGLLRGRAREPDPIGEALRRDAMQRAMAIYANRHGGIVSGQVGDQGIVLLTGGPPTGARARASLLELTARAADMARRLGLRLHAGIAVGSGSRTLAQTYRVALDAADRALVRGTATVIAEETPEPSAGRLSALRASLAAGVEERPELLSVRFETYMDAVVNSAGHGNDATRARLQLGLERLADPLLSSGQLDARTFEEICRTIEAVPRGVGTASELLETCRIAVAKMQRAIEKPTETRQARSLERALGFMREHLSENITLARAARVAHFSPSHFARLFKRDLGTTFERYLVRIRIERAARLLTTMSMPVGRVAEQSGFRSRPHFQAAFRQSTGETPLAYRRRTRI